jgi:hypothetical protein
MVRDPAYGLTAEALEYARQRYEKTDQPARTIAHDVGISRDKLYKIIKAEGWPLREDRPPRGLSEALKLDLEATEAENKLTEASQAEASGAEASEAEACQAEHGAANPDIAPNPDSIAARLEAALEKQLRTVESLRSESGPRVKRSAEAERVARTLATLTETLFKVRRLRQPGGSQTTDDDDLPSDPDGFRLALAHRIEAFVRSRTDGNLAEPGELEDGEPAAS